MQNFGRIQLLLVTGFSFAAISPAVYAADLFISESLRPIYSVSREGDFGADTETQTTIGLDSRFNGGWRFGKFFAGATVNLLYQGTDMDPLAGPPAVPGIDQNTKRFEVGPTLGYVNGGFEFLATYLPYSVKVVSFREFETDGTVNDNFETTDYSRSGYQLAVGYTFSFGRSARGGGFRVGPSLVYRRVAYRSQTLDDQLDPNRNYTRQAYQSEPVESSIQPMLTFSIDF